MHYQLHAALYGIYKLMYRAIISIDEFARVQGNKTINVTARDPDLRGINLILPIIIHHYGLKAVVIDIFRPYPHMFDVQSGAFYCTTIDYA